MSSDALKKLQDKYKGLVQREKILVATAIVLVPVFLLFNLFLDPALMKIKAQETSLRTGQSDLASARNKLLILNANAAVDRNEGKRKELAQLQQKAKDLRQQLYQRNQSVINPQDMNQLLTQILVKTPGLRLISITSLPPTDALSAIKKKPEPGAANEAPELNSHETQLNMLKHGVTITLTGQYNELVSYVKHLEKSPHRLIWGKLDYRVSQYPQAIMQLTLYTLSEDKTWLAF